MARKTTLPKGVSGTKKKRPGKYKRTPAHKEKAREAGAKGGRSRSPAKVAAVQKNGREHGGRPSLYKPEYVEALMAFFKGDAVREVQRVIERKNQDPIIVTEEKGAHLPTFEDFAESIGVDPGTVDDWAQKYPEFGQAKKRAKARQAHFIQVNALLGHYTPAFSIFFAKNNMGWKDATAHTGPDGGAIQHDHSVATLDREEFDRRRAETKAKLKQRTAAEN